MNSRKKKKDYSLYYKIGAAAALVLIIVGIILAVRSCAAKKPGETGPETGAVTETAAPEQTTLSAEEIARAKAEEEERKRQAEIDEILSVYDDLALVKVEEGGFLNMRQMPDANSHIIGKLYHMSACSIMEEDSAWYNTDEWKLVSSGGIQGYVNAQYLITGEEAKETAPDYIKERAIVTADSLYVRSEPSTDAEILDSLMKGERYEVLGKPDGWIRIDRGYISAEYAEVKQCLNEARKLDMKSMALNQYDNLGISHVDNYLNIREKPGEDGKIIGKLPKNAGADILEEENGWYKIQSGPVKGYVKKDFLLTGNDARALALQTADLMAVVTTDVLNVRTAPNTDAAVWTQITSAERYPVVKQLDGWVEIDLGDTDENGEEVTAFTSTDYVNVRYALQEAIKFSPLEEAAANSSRIRNKLVNFALQYVGNPYVWGGTSLTKGCDCSGFALRVMEQFGVYLPHYSGDQSKMGKKVTSADMRPGDLIFYANSGGTINHVAIYIGNGQIVHAANKKSGIKISSWNYRSPKAIRNVLGD